MRSFLLVCAIAIAALGGATAQEPAPAAERVALVIGNAAYQHAEVLRNPVSDAQIVTEALRRAGFSVIDVQTDLTIDQFQSRLRAFQRTAEGAEVALIYYAGHGVEVSGENWLVPVDAQLRNTNDLNLGAVKLADLFTSLQYAALQMVVIDACRDNPFPQMAADNTRGLAPVGLAPVGLAAYGQFGTLTLYSAAANRRATDGSGGNSPFAIAFSETMTRRGVGIHRFGSYVREKTLELTSNQQSPNEVSSISSADFYFVDNRGRTSSRISTQEAESQGEEESGQRPAPSDFVARPGNPEALASLTRRDTAPLARTDFEAIATRLGVEWEALAAVAEGASGPLGGFAATGRPIILFERHLFSRYTGGQFDASHPNISSRNAGGYPRTQDERWAQLSEAFALDAEAALSATSFGRFQILGNVGRQSRAFLGAAALVQLMSRSEREQLEVFASFVESAGLVDELQRRDWAGFARGYNGPNYAARQYDERYMRAYERLKVTPIA